MSFKFPYRQGTVNNKKILYLIVAITLQTVQGKRRYLFIIDTGADLLTLPKYMQHLLDIDKSKFSESISYGINEKPVKTTVGEIDITFCGETFPIRCAFTDNNRIPLLLGREGVFDRFNIRFDNDAETTVFERRM